MNNNIDQKFFDLSPAELAQLGGGALGYIREIEGRDALKLIGEGAILTEPAAKASAA